MLFEAYPIVFEQGHHFSPSTSNPPSVNGHCMSVSCACLCLVGALGLMYMPLTVGNIVGLGLVRCLFFSLDLISRPPFISTLTYAHSTSSSSNLPMSAKCANTHPLPCPPRNDSPPRSGPRRSSPSRFSGLGGRPSPASTSGCP